MSKKTLIIILSVVLVLFIACVVFLTLRKTLNSRQNFIDESISETTTTVKYENFQYGFAFALPTSWKGYSVLTDQWSGQLLDAKIAEISTIGPKISIRHPNWTVDNPRQDIPIMVFTLEQWTLIQQEKLAVSAAPIGPSELGRNDKYIFAIPARYNFAFPTGFEEVEEILKSGAFVSL